MVRRVLTALCVAMGIVALMTVPHAAQGTEHVVRQGETLSAIARSYDVSVNDLVQWNELSDPHRIRPGQVLRVVPRQVTYVVQPGDTLAAISARFRTDITRLAAWNGLDNPDRLYPGQVLVVSPGAIERHIVRRGETLWDISRVYGVPLDTLAESNGVRNPQRLRIGQQLTIPVMATGGPANTSPGPIARPGAAVREGQIAFQWPLQGRITSRFGPRWGRMHNGLDIAAPTGTPVRTAAAGVVTYAGWAGGYGRLIVIDHGGGVETRYAHHSANLVREGERVAQGQVIARVGSTGNSTGPHLHFEVLIDGEHQDPERWLPRR